MAIQVRRGNEADFDPSKMLPGEWAVSLDTKYVRMCFSPGVCLRMATYEAFEADMAKIEAILKEAQTIEEAIEKLQTEINATAVEVENFANSAEQSAKEAKEYAEAAAESASKVEALTGPVVSGIKGSAETDFHTGQVTMSPEDLGLGDVLTDIETLSEQMHEYKPPAPILRTVDEITEFLDNTVIPKENDTWYRSVANLYVSYPAFGTGGRMYIEGFRATNVFQWQTASIYNQQDGKKTWSRSKNGTDAWTDWKKLPSDTDLANYLPLGGGNMKGNVYTQHVYPLEDGKYQLGWTTNAWQDIISNKVRLYKNKNNYGSFDVGREGTESVDGYSALTLGNNIPSGTVGNAYGVLTLFGTEDKYTQVVSSATDASNLVKLPTSAGTLALTSDITALNTLTTHEQDVVTYFIESIFPNQNVAQGVPSGAFETASGHYAWHGMYPVEKFASYVLYGYNMRAIHMQLNNGVWTYNAMDNK